MTYFTITIWRLYLIRVVLRTNIDEHLPMNICERTDVFYYCSGCKVLADLDNVEDLGLNLITKKNKRADMDGPRLRGGL